MRKKLNKKILNVYNNIRHKDENRINVTMSKNEQDECVVYINKLGQKHESINEFEGEDFCPVQNTDKLYLEYKNLMEKL